MGVSDANTCMSLYEHLHMPRLTVTIDESDKEYIESKSGDGEEYDSMSEVVRNCIQAHKRVDSLEDRLESREKRVQELEEQLARRSQVEEKVEEVALEVREDREENRAPFFVEWWNWWKGR